MKEKIKSKAIYFYEVTVFICLLIAKDIKNSSILGAISFILNFVFILLLMSVELTNTSRGAIIVLFMYGVGKTNTIVYNKLIAEKEDDED